MKPSRRRWRKRPALDRTRQTLPASELVARVLEDRKLMEELRRARLEIEWKRAVGERIGARTRVRSLQDGVLHLAVWDSAWLHQLSFMQEDLIVQINEYMGDSSLVSELRMAVGRIRPRDRLPAPETRPRPARQRWRFLPEPATGDSLAAIEKEAACIEDPELRELIIDLRRRWDL